MNTYIRTITVGAAAAVAALSMSVGPAFAFHCYNASRSDQGNAAAAGASAQLSMAEALVMFCGVAEENVDDALAAFEGAGFDSGALINFHAVMAGGLEKNGKGAEKLDDGKGIDHFGEEFEAAIDAAAIAAGGECED